MQPQLTCPLCTKQYKDDNLPRLLLMTGQTYCQNCIKSLITTKLNEDGTQSITLTCPGDQSIIELKTDDITKFPKNIALIKVIQAKKASLSFRDEEESINVSKIAKQEEIQEDDDANELITAMNEGDENPNDIQSPEKKQKQPQFCLLHQKPLEIVCMVDLIKICANCAIFGDQHKGHSFRSLQEIEKERTKYYNEILIIMADQQSINDKIQNKQTYDGIMDILEKKKDKMKKEMNEHYGKLKKAIEIHEKKSQGNLDEVFEKTQKKFKNLMKFDAKILNKYKKWQQESYHQIKILQGTAFQQKLSIIFPQHQINHLDIHNQGKQILSEMSSQIENLISEVDLVLQNINILHSNSIYNSLEHFIIIQEQQKKNSSRTGHSRHEEDKNKLSNQYSQQKMESSPMEESLLDIDDQEDIELVKPQFSKTQDENFLAKVEEANKIEKLDIIFRADERIDDRKNIKTIPIQSMTERPNKKKLAKLKLSEKFDKVLKGILSDSLQNVDFTNAELGDANLILICEFIKGTKVKNMKLIRNKLSDDGIKRIIPYLSNIITLNLSQNNLTEHVTDIIIDNMGYLPNLKSLILSQNKIDERKHKIRIDKLRKLQITVSV